MITQQRAEEIWQMRSATNCTSHLLTSTEHAEISAEWGRMPSYTRFIDAFFRFLQGEATAQKSTIEGRCT